MFQFNKYILFFIFSFICSIFCQGDGGGDSSSGASCSSCCYPSIPSSLLTFKEGFSLALGSLIFINIIRFCLRYHLTQTKLHKKLPYKGLYPSNPILYHGHYSQDDLWFKMNDILLKINDNYIDGTGVDEGGVYSLFDPMLPFNDNIQTVYLKKEYQRDTESPHENLDIELIPTKIAGSINPAFIGTYRSCLKEGIWFMIPKECDYDTPKQLFPEVPEKGSKFSIFILIGLLCLTLSIIIHYSIAMPNFYSTVYVDNAVGIPWGGFLSLFGEFEIVFYIAISVITIAFALNDIFSADFIKSYNLTPTSGFYFQDIKDQCHFSQWGCSVYWNGNYTKQNSTCLGKYRTECISFGNLGSNDCQQEQNALFNY